MSSRMKNGYRRPTGPLTYQRYDGWRHYFDGTREPVVRWRVFDGSGRVVCAARSEAEAQAFIKEADGE